MESSFSDDLLTFLDMWNMSECKFFQEMLDLKLGIRGKAAHEQITLGFNQPITGYVSM